MTKDLVQRIQQSDAKRAKLGVPHEAGEADFWTEKELPTLSSSIRGGPQPILEGPGGRTLLSSMGFVFGED